MHRILFTIAIFAMSFLVTSQVLVLSRGEGTLMTWVLILIGVAGFIAAIRARRPPAPSSR